MDVKYWTMPGLAGSDQGHWQTIWEKERPEEFFRVEQENWDWPVKSQWVSRLQENLERAKNPVILIAHSLGCMTLVHWSNLYKSEKVAGALLVAPADVEHSPRLSFVEGFRPVPVVKLPFPSILIASTNDIYMTIERSAYFAEQWGSEFVNVGEYGHINASSGLSDWPLGKSYLEDLVNQIGHFR